MNLPNDHWVLSIIVPPCTTSFEQAEQYQASLTKPLGALGRLEDIAKQFCSWQKTLTPELSNIRICVFAADHGIVAQGVTPYPQAVTGQMVANFANGGAAICVLAKQIKATMTVVDVGVNGPVSPGVENEKLLPGTNDIFVEPAMTQTVALKALEVGKKYALLKAGDKPSQLNVGGEMGIGNSTIASVLYAAQLSLTADEVAGPGTGLDVEGVTQKAQIIAQILKVHNVRELTPWQRLITLGGIEIIALVGFYLASAKAGIPCVVDGFIAGAAAMMAMVFNPAVKPWLIFSHCSAEPAHQKIMALLGVVPLVDFKMRLGEGSGAALVVPILQSALALHNNMATFDSAGVSQA